MPHRDNHRAPYQNKNHKTSKSKSTNQQHKNGRSKMLALFEQWGDICGDNRKTVYNTAFYRLVVHVEVTLAATLICNKRENEPDFCFAIQHSFFLAGFERLTFQIIFWQFVSPDPVLFYYMWCPYHTEIHELIISNIDNKIFDDLIITGIYHRAQQTFLDKFCFLIGRIDGNIYVLFFHAL